MTETNDSLKNAPRFDWMQQTIHEDPLDIIDVLAGTLGTDQEAARGLNGYHRSTVLRRDGETLARVLYGGPNGWPNVVTTGPATDDVEPVLRTAWDHQQVTRMDTAQDFDQQGGYDAVRGQMVELASRSRIAKYEIESTVNGVRSRTCYLGSPASRVRVRLYEKGMFEWQLGHEDASPSWFRMESQIRPTGADARMKAAELDATEAWGFSRWTRELAQLVMGIEVAPVTMQLRREPDYMRAVRHLQRQYGATLEKALLTEGSWDAVGRLLGVVK